MNSKAELTLVEDIKNRGIEVTLTVTLESKSFLSELRMSEDRNLIQQVASTMGSKMRNQASEELAKLLKETKIKAIVR